MSVGTTASMIRPANPGMRGRRQACDECGIAMQAESLQRRADEAREELENQQGTGTWRSFQNIMAMLSQADALDGESIFQAGRASEAAGRAAGVEARGSQRVQLLPLGDVARQINGTNELWLATVLTSPELRVWPRLVMLS